MNKTLTNLETRLRSLETADGEQTTDVVLADSIEQATDTAVVDDVEQAVDTTVPDSDAGDSGSGRMSETNLGHWMNETLSAEPYWDLEWTEQAREQTLESLAEVPDVNLEDMQCREDFCRATFADENGEKPAIQELFGEPPFLTEGFTIDEADGRVSVYFTRPGVSLGELRSEALEAAQLGLSW